MPSVFLSPSLQPFNPYVIGGNEQQYMNYVADALEPYLRANGISYGRSSPDMTLAQAIEMSNSGDYDLHLALHSNAAAGENAGKLRGYQAYYYTYSAQGRRAADIIVENAKRIYPLPDLVFSVPVTNLAELRRTKAPAVLIEIAYHDNLDDARWIANNIQSIAKNLAQSLTQFFGMSFKDVCTGTGATLASLGYYEAGNYARVCTMSTPLNIRRNPNVQSDVIGSIPRGELTLVLAAPANGWVKIRYNSTEGYVSADYLCACTQTGGQREGVVTTNGANLNLRNRPADMAPVIGRIPNGTRLPILEQVGDWYKVNFNGTLGYAAARYIREVS